MLAHESRSWRGRLHVRQAAERPPAPKGRLVEFVRLIFVTLFAGFGTFTPDHFGMALDTTDNLINWALALTGWGVAIYALWQACLHAEGDC